VRRRFATATVALNLDGKMPSNAKYRKTGDDHKRHSANETALKAFASKIGAMGQLSSYVALRFPIDYCIDAFSFDALRVDFCARPLAKIRMSSDLPLPIKRPNSSAVNGRFSSWTRGPRVPKNALNQRPSRSIRDDLHVRPPTDCGGKCSKQGVQGKVPPRIPSWTRSYSIDAQGFGHAGKPQPLNAT
jgi:hypothetical protein